MLPKPATLLLAIALLGFSNPGWAQDSTVVSWGDNRFGQTNVPAGLNNVVAIASGEWHNLALKADGTLVAWGVNNAGQRNIPADLTNVVAIGGGGYHNMALKPDGTVRAWGANDYGQSTVPAGLSNVVSLKAGWVHSVALKADGTVRAWGRSSEGQINVPTGLTNVEAIAVGEYHNLALKSDGTLVGWGWNGFGAASIPEGLHGNVIAIAAGGLHSLALKKDGTVFAWGWNRYGQATVPPGLSNVVAIAGGAEHSLALKADGTVVGWGANDGWAENDPNCAIIDDTPCPRKTTGQIAPPANVTNIVAIAAGVFHSIALRGSVPQLPPIPSVPGNLTAEIAASNAIELRWTDNSTNETGFRIERIGPAGTVELTTDADVTSYRDSGLAAETLYQYRIQALNNSGASAYTTEITVQTPGVPIPPEAPTQLQVTAVSPTEIDFAWTDNSTNETGFRIERVGPAGMVELTTDADVTSYRDSSLAADTLYYYRIQAFNNSGASAYTTEISVQTPPLPMPPEAPTQLQVHVVSSTEIGLRWTDNSTNETGFRIQRSNTTGIVEIDVGANATSHRDSGLAPDTTYSYRIQSYNSNGTSIPSSAVSATTLTLSSNLAEVEYVTTDTNTMGNWSSLFGGDGYAIANFETQNPAYGTITPSNQLNYTLEEGTSDVRALLRSPGDTNRIVSGWYGDQFTVSLNFTDTNTHQVAIYILDWERSGRVQTFQLFDAISGNPLDEREVSDFGEGKYIVWKIKGQVDVHVTKNSGTNAVVMGVFTGPSPANPIVPPYLENARLLDPGTFSFSANGEPGLRFVVEISDDVREWRPFQTNTLSAPVWTFTDTNITETAQRYYRIRAER